MCLHVYFVVLGDIYLLYQVNNKYNNTKYLLDNKRTNVLKILQITQVYCKSVYITVKVDSLI